MLRESRTRSVPRRRPRFDAVLTTNTSARRVQHSSPVVVGRRASVRQPDRPVDSKATTLENSRRLSSLSSPSAASTQVVALEQLVGDSLKAQLDDLKRRTLYAFHTSVMRRRVQPDLLSQFVYSFVAPLAVKLMHVDGPIIPSLGTHRPPLHHVLDLDSAAASRKASSRAISVFILVRRLGRGHAMSASEVKSVVERFHAVEGRKHFSFDPSSTRSWRLVLDLDSAAASRKASSRAISSTVLCVSCRSDLAFIIPSLGAHHSRR
ncbi:hypothetical protein JCM8208_004640 [Rhodotorula glutinis]